MRQIPVRAYKFYVLSISADLSELHSKGLVEELRSAKCKLYLGLLTSLQSLLSVDF